MSVDQYITYQKFSDYTTALEFGTLLKDNQIDYVIEDTSLQFDSFFSTQESNKEYSIRIKQDDFSKTDNLLLQNTSKDLEAMREDHYLIHFTNEELYDVVAKRNEWNEFDFQFAQKILKERGQEIKKETIDELEAQRLLELSKPQKIENGWMYVGYISAILGGLFGIIIGWHISFNKKKLPDGSTIYSYDQSDRKSGKMMLIIGVIVFSIGLITRVLYL